MFIDDILIRFLVLVTAIFFVPKIINRYFRIPSPITEIILGVALGVFLPRYFYLDDITSVLSTLGIITLFVYAGMEVNMDFLLKNRRFLLENILINLSIFLLVGVILVFVFNFSFVLSLLISLALITPSASFILSSFNGESDSSRYWVETKALTGEVLSLLLMIILLGISSPQRLLLNLGILLILLFALPFVLKFMYRKFFSKLIGTEFSFILVIALIAAFLTEFIGVHYLIGAFIVGLISRRFISEIVEDYRYTHINEEKGKQIMASFNMFAITFIPFYFFSVGLKLNQGIFTWNNVTLALILLFTMSLVRILPTTLHRILRKKETFLEAFKINSRLIPTLVFTFVIAEILIKEFPSIEPFYGCLMLYGIFSAILAMILFFLTSHNKHS